MIQIHKRPASSAQFKTAETVVLRFSNTLTGKYFEKEYASNIEAGEIVNDFLKEVERERL